MENFTPYSALAGGAFIGFAAVILLAFNGRIAGISGIMNGAISGSRDSMWRWCFLAGLLVGGGAYIWLTPLQFVVRTNFPVPMTIVAGLLVGFGTRMGSGCTSGHGVCGIARLSVRSIVATLVFVAAGIATVFVTRQMLGAAYA